MKNNYIKLTTLLLTFCLQISASFAQAPQGMSYQAVVRNSSNVLITSAPVGMKISILQGSSSGTAVYVETQTPSTNANGLVTITIGSGVLVSGNFSNIDWSVGPYFIKSETDPTGGTTYTITGTTQIMSVPYALYAAKSGTPGTTGPTGANGVTGLAGTNGVTGPTGLAGSGGAVGATGAQGTTGVAGANGTTGTQGIQGVTGANGKDGAIIRGTYASNATWICPNNVTKIVITLWGGSGGGAYCTIGYGGNGGYLRQEITVIPGNSYNIVIGWGGAGAPNSSISATDGGSTSFDVYSAENGKGATIFCNDGVSGSINNYMPTFDAPPSYLSGKIITPPSNVAPGGWPSATCCYGPGSPGKPGFCLIEY